MTEMNEERKNCTSTGNRYIWYPSQSEMSNDEVFCASKNAKKGERKV